MHLLALDGSWSWKKVRWRGLARPRSGRSSQSSRAQRATRPVTRAAKPPPPPFLPPCGKNISRAVGTGHNGSGRDNETGGMMRRKTCRQSGLPTRPIVEAVVPLPGLNGVSCLGVWAWPELAWPALQHKRPAPAPPSAQRRSVLFNTILSGRGFLSEDRAFCKGRSQLPIPSVREAEAQRPTARGQVATAAAAAKQRKARPIHCLAPAVLMRDQPYPRPPPAPAHTGTGSALAPRAIANADALSSTSRRSKYIVILAPERLSR